MKSVFVSLVILSTLLLGAFAATAQVRYANGMPQFGSSTVRAFLPPTLLFDSVPGGSLTAYTNLTAPHWYVFTASYNRNVTALSNPYLVNASSYYSLFTYQIAEKRVLNKLIQDTCTNSNNNSALLRTVNLVQYNYPINVYNFSNNAVLFENLTYGEASDYTQVPPGDYVLYWTSAATAKRGLHGSNLSGDPLLYGGRAYTFWVFPTGSFIYDDCFPPPSKKRNLNVNSNGVSISNFRMRRAVNRDNAVNLNAVKESEMAVNNEITAEASSQSKN